MRAQLYTVNFLLAFFASLVLGQANDRYIAINRRQVSVGPSVVVGVGTGFSSSGSGAPSVSTLPSSTSTPPTNQSSSTVAPPTSIPSDTTSSSSVVATSSPPKTSDAASSPLSSSLSSSTTTPSSTLVITTTDSNGNSVTLTGAAASSATKVITHTSPLLGTETKKTVVTIHTVRGSSTIAEKVTENTVITATTGFATWTTHPILNGDSSGSSGSLSSTSKKVIGGVVGGIGGAALLGGILMVVWRLWGKNKTSTDEDEDLMHSSHQSLDEKRVSQRRSRALSGSPLGRYGEIGPTRVNTAQNF